MNKRRVNVPLRYIIFILVFVCVGLMVASVVSPSFANAVTGAGYRVLAPIQNTLNRAGNSLTSTFSEIGSMSSLREENAALSARVEELEEENRLLYQSLYELDSLRELYGLSEDYHQFEMVGARIIQRSNGNWYHEFVINKGSDDGIYLGSNVIADGALVGRVTYVGPNYSRVLSIIDDSSNVGGVSRENGSYCVVRGDLALYQEGHLRIDHIRGDAVIEDGDLIVTSNTSNVYFPGIAIGYASGVEMSANNLTQTGWLTPIADFSDLENVLVIVTPNTLDAISATGDGALEDPSTDPEAGMETSGETETAGEPEPASDEGGED
ncbi:MAG: rod shape-determining protein MreC [Lachnospiraceae bacterium]|nr:rod shape-determining protein MreC [Lachnospiraceae bacterium]MBQ3401222.1 rod shape-determining protein MreC [Lachnospiraceae bacterium]MBQ4309047.1 rod shape-determining protein MreC [Lachnospiraceae bacterium]MBR0401069.1 rod shape-determining protein MreC [Lachnospiraceae bacterium]